MEYVYFIVECTDFGGYKEHDLFLHATREGALAHIQELPDNDIPVFDDESSELSPRYYICKRELLS